MGRGNSDILFNSDLLHAAQKRSLNPQRGYSYFTTSVDELFLHPKLSLLKSEEGPLCYLDENLQEHKRGHALFPDSWGIDRKIDIKDNHLVVSDGVSFIIENIQNGEKLEWEGPDGFLEEISIIGNTVFALAIDVRDNFRQHLFKRSIGEQGSWEDIIIDKEAQNISLKNKGDSSFLIYKDASNAHEVWAPLEEKGLGKKGRIASLELIKQMSFPLIAPLEHGEGKEDSYLAVLKDENGDNCVTKLSLESFAVHGPLAIKKIASLGPDSDDIDSCHFREMISYQGRCLLLGDRELILLDDKGVVQTIPIKEEAREFDRLSFDGSRAILWSPGQRKYQEFKLPSLKKKKTPV